MSITRFASLISLASLAFVTGCTPSKPDSEQLDQLMRRTSALEQQVHALETSNAELQKQVWTLQQQRLQNPPAPGWSPPQNPQMPPWGPPPQNPQVPPPNQPPANQVPQPTPLDTK